MASGFRRPGTVVLGLLATAVLFTPGNLASAAARARCPADLDQYHTPRSAFEACGISTFPVTGISNLPGGGHAYSYKVGGMMVTLRVPPASFDPATASSARLAQYYFPPRPASAAAAARWKQQYGHSRAVPAPPFLVQADVSLAPPALIPASRPDARPAVRSPEHYLAYQNLAGYGALGKNKKCVTSCYGSTTFGFDEPALHHSSCRRNAEATFDMIGGLGLTTRKSHNFAQVGTMAWQGYTFKGFREHQPYMIGSGPMARPIGLPSLGIKGGTEVAGEMSLKQLAGKNGGSAYFIYGFMQNDKTKHEDSFSAYPLSRKTMGGNYDFSTASWGIERPLVPGGSVRKPHYTNLSNFGTTTYILGGDNLGKFTNGKYDELSMLEQNHSQQDAAFPSPVYRNGQSFAIKQYSCR